MPSRSKIILTSNTSILLHLGRRLLTILENIGKIATASLITILILIFLFPAFSFSLGNVFFGDVGPLYNVQLAQFLFKQAAYPALSQSSVPYAHYQLSRTKFISGDFFAALDEARTELRLYPEHTGTYYILGLTYGYMNRNHEAIDAFSRYIETHPNTWAGRNDKAWLQFRIGDMAGALETVEPVVASYPRTPWIQNTYCALLINQDRLAEAEIACNNAREIIQGMSDKDWGYAYPGNDPAIYGVGLEQMRQSIEQNLELLANKRSQVRT